jgi:hypothetical protein
MTTEKTKQTLYNFVSLRSPQSTKSHEKGFRFIELPSLDKCKRNEYEELIAKNLKLPENFKEFEAMVNDDAGIADSENEDAKKCHVLTDKERELQKFTKRAKFISENKGEIDFDYLEQLHLKPFKNISSAKVFLLFSELVQHINESKDFQNKQTICEWLMFWNLLNRFCDLKIQVEAEKALKEADDKKNHIYSFCGAESQRDFRNAAAKPYIEQLLNATIILPSAEQLRKENNDDNDDYEKLAVLRKGPIELNSTRSYSQPKPAFVPSDKLNRKHEINLANFQLEQLEKTANPDPAKVLQLRSTILENISFSHTRAFVAGLYVNTDSDDSEFGVKASILNNGGKYCLLISSNDKRVPYGATIWTKKDKSNVFETPIPIKNFPPSGADWSIELPNKPDLNLDTDNFFIELNYVGSGNDSISLTSFQLVPVSGKQATEFQGWGETAYSKGFKFTADLSKSHLRNTDDPKPHDDNVDPKETKHFDCELVLRDGIDALINEKTDNSGNIIGKPVQMTVGFFDENGPQSPEINKNEIKYDSLAKTLTLTLKDFPENLNKNGDFGVYIFMRFANGKNYYSLPFKIKWDDKTLRSGDSFFIMDSGYDAYGKTYAPKGFGITQLGVADYQRVTSHVIRYEAGEVAHIENLMGREYKEKVVTKEHITEITEFDSLETETEKLNDATSAERFQLQTEIAKMQHEENQTKIDANISYNGGTTTASLNYGNNTASSREESNKQAINTGKELTKRAMERIVTKVKKETTSKVTDKLTDVSKHGFDNRGSSDHVSGVYRYINAIYKNEIDNYGKRLAYEFMIPQPSKLHNLGMLANTESDGLETLEKPLDPRKISLDGGKTSFNWEQLNETNYIQIARDYDAEVQPYPKVKFISESIKNSDFPTTSIFSKTITAEEGYVFTNAKVFATGRQATNVAGIGQFELTVGTQQSKKDLTNIDGEIHSVTPYDIPLDNLSVLTYLINIVRITVVDFSILFTLTPHANQESWKHLVFKQIFDAYEERLKEYNSKVAAIKQDAKEAFEDNPLNFRQIEQTILRMNCISYLIAPYGEFPNRNFGRDLYLQYGTDKFTSTRVDNSKELDEYAAFVKFIEQAFEWNIMSYNFYPFYWGRYSDWHTLYHNDINDALFKSFMQAGMARVMVTVRPGFEHAVLLYMITGKIWEGGYVPVYGDDLYVSMANELKEPEYKVKGSWETVLPTNLLALQKGGAVINTHGLPNLEKPVVDEDDDEINAKGSSLNPLISNNEKVLETKKMSFFQRLRLLFLSGE